MICNILWTYFFLEKQNEEDSFNHHHKYMAIVKIHKAYFDQKRSQLCAFPSGLGIIDHA
jgi:hypothetical protein